MADVIRLECNVGELDFIAGSSMARSVQLRRYHDPGVEYLMRKYSAHLDTFFDVGANVGLFSVLAGVIRGDGPGVTVAFEPDRNNLACLRDNLARRGERAIRVIEKAVFSSDGVVLLGVIDCGLSTNSKAERTAIPCVALSSFCNQTGLWPTFLKMDVEGAEMSVLEGAEQVIAKRRTLFEMEFSYRDHRAGLDRLLEMFPSDQWVMECHLRDTEQRFFPMLEANGVAACRVKHVASNQVFWPAVCRSDADRDLLIDIMRQSTEEQHSRKWEVLLVPREMNIGDLEAAVEGYQIGRLQ